MATDIISTSLSGSSFQGDMTNWLIMGSRLSTFSHTSSS